MESLKTSAIVIKSINWSDSSRIITLFTREKGRVDVVAKGSRKIKSKFHGLLETMNLVDTVIYFSSKRELQTLGEVSIENSFQSIRSDLTKTGSAFSILELVHLYFHQGAGDQIFFDFLKEILISVNKSDDPEIVLWYFMLKLSSYLGFKPEFKLCRICEKNVQQEVVEFNLAEGSVVCENCNNHSNQESRFPKYTRDYLLLLQNTSYKKVLLINSPKNREFPYLQFLISYLQHHTEQRLELSSMKYFK